MALLTNEILLLNAYRLRRVGPTEKYSCTLLLTLGGLTSLKTHWGGLA